MMNLEQFKLELIAAQKRILKYGLWFFLISGIVAVLVIVFGGGFDRSVIIGLCFTGLFLLIGFFMMFTSFKWIQQIKSGEYELIKAIENKLDFPDYIVWIYQSTMVTEHNVIAKKSKNYHLVVNNNKGRVFQFMPNTEQQVQDMIEFLSERFPNALVGYSEENKKLAKERIRK